MPATSSAGGRRVLERLGVAIETFVFKGVDDSFQPRLAAGLVGYPHPGVSRVEDLLALAEVALLRGKQGDGQVLGRKGAAA
jgi:hypothetical protein